MAKRPYATPFDPFAQFLEFIPWVSIDGYTKGGDAGYAVAAFGTSVTLTTGNTTDKDAYLTISNPWYKLIATGKIITVEFILNNLFEITNQNIWLRIADLTSDPPSETKEHIGWKIIGADLYASNADGVTQTITDTTVDLATGSQQTRLKMIFNPGTDCKFYVDDVLKVTHIANLPTSPSPYLHFHIRTLENAVKRITLGRVLMQKLYT